MRAGAHKDQLSFCRAIDQKPIGRDMAFTVIGIIPDQQMIAITFFQSFTSLQRPDDFSQPLQVFPLGV